MSEEISISEALDDLLLMVFEHAFDSIDEGGPLIPFAVTERDEERSLARFMAENLEEGVEMGRKALKTMSPRPERAALAIDGYLRTGDGDRIDAIFVEAYEDGEARAYRFAVPYRPGDESSGVEPLEEEPILLEECDPLF